jgi:hypothetical protein
MDRYSGDLFCHRSYLAEIESSYPLDYLGSSEFILTNSETRVEGYRQTIGMFDSGLNTTLMKEKNIVLVAEVAFILAICLVMSSFKNPETPGMLEESQFTEISAELNSEEWQSNVK